MANNFKNNAKKKFFCNHHRTILNTKLRLISNDVRNLNRQKQPSKSLTKLEKLGPTFSGLCFFDSRFRQGWHSPFKINNQWVKLDKNLRAARFGCFRGMTLNYSWPLQRIISLSAQLCYKVTLFLHLMAVRSRSFVFVYIFSKMNKVAPGPAVIDQRSRDDNDFRECFSTGSSVFRDVCAVCVDICDACVDICSCLSECMACLACSPP